jgi:hypothetical protein
VGYIVNVNMGSFELISFSIGTDSYNDTGYSFPSSLVRVCHVPWELGDLLFIIYFLINACNFKVMANFTELNDGN